MATLYEIQASYVGIGKSTFAQKFNLPFADDCINLVDSLSDYWYTESSYFLSPDSKTEALFKAYLVLENSACAISEALSKNLGNIVISARSALVSAFQFLQFQPSLEQIMSLVDYYQARLQHMGVKKVVVLDFGPSIMRHDEHVMTGYNRMRERARPYELNFFISFEKYKCFFQLAELNKYPMVRELQKRGHMFQYETLEFSNFNIQNYCQVLGLIRGRELSRGEIKMQSDSCWNVRDLGILTRVVAPLLMQHEPDQVFPTWQVALDQHRRNNRHHPEFFEWLGSMTVLDKQEMLCDLLSCFLTGQWKRGNLDWKIDEAANICRRWQNWEIVNSLYKGEYTVTNKETKLRWPLNKFDHEKEWLILWVQALLTRRVSMDTFIEGLYGFDSIHYYVQDLMWHQSSVIEMAKKLFPDNRELTQRCEVHDFDKWDAFMVTAYTLKFIFQVEIVPIVKISELDEKTLQSIVLRANDQESKLTEPKLPEL